METGTGSLFLLVDASVRYVETEVSYDLMVFDPAFAPRSHAAFLAWYEAQQTNDEDVPPSDDPKSLTPALQSWFAEMIRTFPPLNGPLANELDVDNPKVTDYGLGRTSIYACFAWSQADAALQHTVKLAEKYGIGLFNLSSDKSDVWIPGVRGQLVKVTD